MAQGVCKVAHVLSPIQMGLTLGCGNKIFTVLLRNLIHHFRRRFNHREITLAKREYQYLVTCH